MPEPVLARFDTSLWRLVFRTVIEMRISEASGISEEGMPFIVKYSSHVSGAFHGQYVRLVIADGQMAPPQSVVLALHLGSFNFCIWC